VQVKNLPCSRDCSSRTFFFVLKGNRMLAEMSGTASFAVMYLSLSFARMLQQETATLPVLLYSDKRFWRSLDTGASHFAAGPRKGAGCSPTFLRDATARFMAGGSRAACPSASSTR